LDIGEFPPVHVFMSGSLTSSLPLTSSTASGQSLAPGKCEQCRIPLDAERFALWHDHATKQRSCAHLVCGTCRGIMCSWPKQHCPNSTCDKRFYAIQDALNPSTATAEELFKFVNYSGSGRITKEELVDWYTTNFNMTRSDVRNAIDSNWQLWDVPKNRPFSQLGWFRSKDQGDLDIDEFPPVQDFMNGSLSRSLTSTPAGRIQVSVPTACAEPHGEKRSRPETDTLTDGVLRNVAQRKQVQSQELQCCLGDHSDKGLKWFNHFDFDKSGELSKPELITALLQTFMGSHQMSREKITSLVNGIWDAIDTDGSGSVHFDEFQILREALIAQLDHDGVAEVIADEC